MKRIFQILLLALAILALPTPSYADTAGLRTLCGDRIFHIEPTLLFDIPKDKGPLFQKYGIYAMGEEPLDFSCEFQQEKDMPALTFTIKAPAITSKMPSALTREIKIGIEAQGRPIANNFPFEATGVRQLSLRGIWLSDFMAKICYDVIDKTKKSDVEFPLAEMHQRCRFFSLGDMQRNPIDGSKIEEILYPKEPPPKFDVP